MHTFKIVHELFKICLDTTLKQLIIKYVMLSHIYENQTRVQITLESINLAE